MQPSWWHLFLDKGSGYWRLYWACFVLKPGNKLQCEGPLATIHRVVVNRFNYLVLLWQPLRMTIRHWNPPGKQGEKHPVEETQEARQNWPGNRYCEDMKEQTQCLWGRQRRSRYFPTASQTVEGGHCQQESRQLSSGLWWRCRLPFLFSIAQPTPHKTVSEGLIPMERQG